MPNTESEVIQIILKRGGKVTKGDIIKKVGISFGYLDIISRSLERRGLIKFSNNVYSLTPLAKKKSAESIQKTKKVELKANPSSRAQAEGRKRGRPKKQKVKSKDNNGPKIKLTEQIPYQFATGQAEESKKSPVETLLEQRIGELKEGVAEAEKKIEKSVKKIEVKIEKELEEKLKTVEEKVRPVAGKVEELPPLVLRFGRFLLSTGRRIFDKTRSKLISIPLWISKKSKNLTKKRS